MYRPKPSKLTVDEAETLALQVLAFVLADPQQTSRFLALTGSIPQDLREIASSRDLQIATLEYLLSDETLLLAYCRDAGIDPALIAPAHALLAGRAPDF